MAKILAIEDDSDTAEPIIGTLTAHGHVATHEADGRTARGRISLPVLMISALSDIDERIAGLRAGGDDDRVTPFAPAEMAMRRVSLSATAEAGAIVIVVRDTGPGLAAYDRRAALRRFYRVVDAAGVPGTGRARPSLQPSRIRMDSG
jgi:DNA-binding response OmpR family regulator